MGFLASNVSITRFKVLADESPDGSSIQDALLGNAFRPIDDTADEVSMGWTSYENMEDMEWSEAPPDKGPYAFFCLRRDTRKVAPALLKKKVNEALAEELENFQAEGYHAVPRDRKKEIKEQVKLRLLAQTHPVPETHDVCWNLRDGTVYLASTSNKIVEAFFELFEATFGLQLEPLRPYYLGRRTMDQPELLDRL